MATLERALQIAAKAHEGQRDKEGKPYILHALRVMMGVEGEMAQIVALLHDVLEDTTVTAEDLRAAGFSEETIVAVECVTHQPTESYADYVIRAKGNEVARQVKLSDLADNSRLDRTIVRPDRIDKDIERIRKYLLSYKYLTDQMDEGTYRRLL